MGDISSQLFNAWRGATGYSFYGDAAANVSNKVYKIKGQWSSSIFNNDIIDPNKSFLLCPMVIPPGIAPYTEVGGNSYYGAVSWKHPLFLQDEFIFSLNWKQVYFGFVTF